MEGRRSCAGPPAVAISVATRRDDSIPTEQRVNHVDGRGRALAERVGQLGDGRERGIHAGSSYWSGRSVLGWTPGPGNAVLAPPRDSPAISASMSGYA